MKICCHFHRPGTLHHRQQHPGDESLPGAGPERARSCGSSCPAARRRRLGGAGGAVRVEPRFEMEWLPSNPRWRRIDFALAAARRARLAGGLVYTWTVQAAVLPCCAGVPPCWRSTTARAGALGPLSGCAPSCACPGASAWRSITDALRRTLESATGAAAPARAVGYRAQWGRAGALRSGCHPPAEARRQLGLPDGMTVGCTGHLYTGRGGELFLALARRFPQAPFVWVGGRPEDVESYRSSGPVGRAGQRDLHRLHAPTRACRSTRPRRTCC